jgi:hypothetical protein
MVLYIDSGGDLGKLCWLHICACLYTFIIFFWTFIVRVCAAGWSYATKLLSKGLTRAAAVAAAELPLPNESERGSCFAFVRERPTDRPPLPLSLSFK